MLSSFDFACFQSDLGLSSKGKRREGGGGLVQTLMLAEVTTMHAVEGMARAYSLHFFKQNLLNSDFFENLSGAFIEGGHNSLIHASNNCKLCRLR